MPDLASIILRKSVGSMKHDRQRCSGCRRTPLVGEQLHEMDTGRVLCQLCLVALPECDRNTVRSELVRASERGLVVAPRAA
jgi:hypothetical protein